MKRWEYRQEAFCTLGGNPDLQPPWWDRQRNGTEQDWLNRLGAEGWELVSIEEQYHLYGRVPMPYVPSGYTGSLSALKCEGAVPAKRWTFRREVEG